MKFPITIFVFLALVGLAGIFWSRQNNRFPISSGETVSAQKQNVDSILTAFSSGMKLSMI
ncbi:MAG: hypothetical protein HYT46_02280 [Candidatus Vogelbacteria bacterium]|nr:hypothetical protein [Candidatus Vogelbacteria bacterium]